ncbi:uncharacterized protein MONOS_8479 [Monocercomonoides exilis]|uniref:uncharacterized protein n=1 Tax=Monocercomonoides exilis TaxID=2049356 RepID=UPI0035599EA8|nr:hypothetical protein MONOS_8479 [Monocercomonoides exilis]|eukprot:MONOS_8479.1-p1 / transcript=MONOS_8479.1 / gene=MONOS_8479 / organism=Monocercomonoides_exilis_PA203 / gene_product=unspecified product / transcript_product=unspecified product / location=Mono_scaffold00320:60872-62818(+) / protein_length=547 / sequence_SO=supercontig / SO=protein_coding / is_pseudo=false
MKKDYLSFLNGIYIKAVNKERWVHEKMGKKKEIVDYQSSSSNDLFFSFFRTEKDLLNLHLPSYFECHRYYIDAVKSLIVQYLTLIGSEYVSVDFALQLHSKTFLTPPPPAANSFTQIDQSSSMKSSSSSTSSAASQTSEQSGFLKRSGGSYKIQAETETLIQAVFSGQNSMMSYSAVQDSTLEKLSVLYCTIRHITEELKELKKEAIADLEEMSEKLQDNFQMVMVAEDSVLYDEVSEESSKLKLSQEQNSKDADELDWKSDSASLAGKTPSAEHRSSSPFPSSSFSSHSQSFSTDFELSPSSGSSQASSANLSYNASTLGIKRKKKKWVSISQMHRHCTSYLIDLFEPIFHTLEDMERRFAELFATKIVVISAGDVVFHSLYEPLFESNRIRVVLDVIKPQLATMVNELPDDETRKIVSSYIFDLLLYVFDQRIFNAALRKRPASLASFNILIEDFDEIKALFKDSFFTQTEIDMRGLATRNSLVMINNDVSELIALADGAKPLGDPVVQMVGLGRIRAILMMRAHHKGETVAHKWYEKHKSSFK